MVWLIGLLFALRCCRVHNVTHHYFRRFTTNCCQQLAMASGPNFRALICTNSVPRCHIVQSITLPLLKCVRLPVYNAPSLTELSLNFQKYHVQCTAFRTTHDHIKLIKISLLYSSGNSSKAGVYHSFKIPVSKMTSLQMGTW